MPSSRSRQRRKGVGRTSFKPDRDATALRLLVEARAGDRKSEQAVRLAVGERLGKDTAGRSWKVTRMFATPGRRTDEELGRFFEVTGLVSASPSYSLQRVGFDVARGLAEVGEPILRAPASQARWGTQTECEAVWGVARFWVRTFAGGLLPGPGLTAT